MEVVFALIFIIAAFALMFNAFIVLLEIIIPVWLVFKLIQLVVRGIRSLFES